MKKLFLFFAAVLFLACARQGNAPTQGDIVITLSPTFESVASRATATAFEEGDQIGLYSTLSGQQLIAQGNRIDNEKFTVASGGVLAATPAVYYPDAKASVELCAYYPYNASTSDATKVGFEVTEDQKASDLCYARSAALPSSEAQVLHFTHKLSRAVFHIALPLNTTLVKATLINAQSRVELNLTDGSITSGSTYKNITLYNKSEAIVPAQIFRKGAKVLEIEATQNSVTERYVYEAEQDITLDEGTITTFNLKLNDNRTATLTAPPLVNLWTTGTTSGKITELAKNSFTVYWALPNASYTLATSATLTVKNLASNESKDYAVTNFVYQSATSSAKLCSYTFDFEPLSAAQLSYPYQIEAVTFRNASNIIIQSCTALVAKSVYKSGNYHLGIEADNLLVVSTTPLIDWGSSSGGGSISGGGVTNDFLVTMVEPSYAYGTIHMIELTIDGAAYAFTSLTSDPTSNKLLAFSSFALPDRSAKSPAIYPYTIERVTLKNSSSGLLYDGYCNIAVSSVGRVGLSLYKGGVITTSASVTASGWGTVISGSGQAIYTGPVGSNLFSFTYANGGATAATECAGVNRVELTIGGSQVIFGSVAMVGNRFVASSVSSYDIISTTGSRPTNYPYSITRIDFYKGTTLVQSASPTAPILVSGSGAVSVKVVK